MKRGVLVIALDVLSKFGLPPLPGGASIRSVQHDFAMDTARFYLVGDGLPEVPDGAPAPHVRLTLGPGGPGRSGDWRLEWDTDVPTSLDAGILPR